MDATSINCILERVSIVFSTVDPRNVGISILNGHDIDITSCYIKYGYNGINLTNTYSISILNTVVDNGTIGIRLMQVSDISIEQCTISKNTDSGIYIHSSSDITIQRSTIRANLKYGIEMYNSTNIIINLNYFCDNGAKIYEDDTDYTETLSSPCADTKQASATKSSTVKRTNYLQYGIIIHGKIYLSNPSRNCIISGGKADIFENKRFNIDRLSVSFFTLFLIY